MKRVLSLSVTTLGLALLMSCGGSDNPVAPASSCQRASEKADAFSAALTAYATNQTPVTCKAFVDAANAYIDAARTCTTITAAQLQAARDGINSTKCQ